LISRDLPNYHFENKATSQFDIDHKKAGISTTKGNIEMN